MDKVGSRYTILRKPTHTSKSTQRLLKIGIEEKKNSKQIHFSLKKQKIQ